jgi:hypothetical protein
MLQRKTPPMAEGLLIVALVSLSAAGCSLQAGIDATNDVAPDPAYEAMAERWFAEKLLNGRADSCAHHLASGLGS